MCAVHSHFRVFALAGPLACSSLSPALPKAGSFCRSELILNVTSSKKPSLTTSCKAAAPPPHPITLSQHPVFIVYRALISNQTFSQFISLLSSWLSCSLHGSQEVKQEGNRIPSPSLAKPFLLQETSLVITALTFSCPVFIPFPLW